MPTYSPTQHALSVLSNAFGTSAFTGTDAEFFGVSPRRLSYLARRGQLIRLHRGLYTLTEDCREQAAALEACAFIAQHGIRPVIGGSFALQMWGIPTDLRCPIIWIPEKSSLRRGRRGDVIFRGGRVNEDQVAVFDEHSVTTPSRSSIDVSCNSSDPAQILWLLCQGMRRECDWHISGSIRSRLTGYGLSQALGDLEMRNRISSRLSSAFEGHHGRGVARVKKLAGLAEPRLESVLECSSWLEFHKAKLPLPTPQKWVRGASGRHFRVDFWWPGVVGEADGALKYTAAPDLWEEKRRQEDLEQAGLIVVRWTWADMTQFPARVMDRLGQAFVRASR